MVWTYIYIYSPWFFSVQYFHIEFLCSSYYFLLSIFLLRNKLVSKRGLIFNDGDYFAFGLQQWIFAMAGRDVGCVAQMDFDDAMLEFDKMPSSWKHEEKYYKDQNALFQINLYLKINYYRTL